MKLSAEPILAGEIIDCVCCGIFALLCSICLLGCTRDSERNVPSEIGLKLSNDFKIVLPPDLKFEASGHYDFSVFDRSRAKADLAMLVGSPSSGSNFLEALHTSKITVAEFTAKPYERYAKLYSWWHPEAFGPGYAIQIVSEKAERRSVLQGSIFLTPTNSAFFLELREVPR